MLIVDYKKLTENDEKSRSLVTLPPWGSERHWHFWKTFRFF